MSRPWTLTLYLARELSGALAGIVPLAAAVAFGLIAFEYGMYQAQLITVGGLGIGTIGFLATLLLAGRADRAATFPMLGRLRWRAELLGSILAGGLGITWILAIAIVLANLLAGRLTLSWPSLLWIVPTWTALWLFSTALALSLSALVSRNGSNLLGYLLVVAVLVGNDRKADLVDRGAGWAVRIVERVVWPVGTLLSRASTEMHDETYFVAAAATLASAAGLFLLAAFLFRDKDLLWSE